LAPPHHRTAGADQHGSWRPAAAGATAPTFTDASLVGVTIKAIHIQELRNVVIALE
jgi:hypothetical protein